MPREKCCRKLQEKSTDAEHRVGTIHSSVETTVIVVERRNGVIRLCLGRQLEKKNRMIDMNKAKPFEIPKRLVWEAWVSVKSKQGSGGVDGETIKSFEKNLGRNLYKIWNRLCSGSYMPPAIKRVEVPKGDGSTRPLGIPTIGDRVAQMVIKKELEPELEKRFHPSSFGYRPGKSAHDAIAQARVNCWKHKWVIDSNVMRTISWCIVAQSIKRKEFLKHYRKGLQHVDWNYTQERPK
jgi:RNA-directed DNA polymerase